MPRFSLKTLLIAAAVVPVAIYLLVNATPDIASFVMSISAVVWIGSVVAWLEGKGQSRAFARGFAVSSLAYGAVTFGVAPVMSMGSLPGTTKLLMRLHEATAKHELSPSGGVIRSYPDTGAFIAVGEFYWCILFGLAGGWLASWLYHKNRKDSQPSAEASAP